MVSFKAIAFSVGDYLDFINLALKPTEKVSVIGEITTLKNHPTGVYITIKDPSVEALLDVYIDPYTFRQIRLPLEPGMLIKLSGVAKIFKRRGSFRFQATNIELAGEGSLKKAYELLKNKLESEGCFNRKREFPRLIQRIAVITSSTGAVLADFENNLDQHGLIVTVLDTRVEGRDAKSQILKSLNFVNKQAKQFDLCVIIRGGGSLEDLQAFNTEEVARAVYNCKVPVLAGIGHDKDVPLVNLTADHSCSTPTATAQIVNEVWNNFEKVITNSSITLENKLARVIELTNYQIWESEKKIFLLENNLRRLIEKISHNLNLQISNFLNRIINTDSTVTRSLSIIENNFSASIREKLNLISLNENIIEAHNPESMLKKGYSIALSESGKLIKSSEQLKIGEKLVLKLKTGSAKVNVESKSK